MKKIISFIILISAVQLSDGMAQSPAPKTNAPYNHDAVLDSVRRNHRTPPKHKPAPVDKMPVRAIDSSNDHIQKKVVPMEPMPVKGYPDTSHHSSKNKR